MSARRLPGHRPHVVRILPEIPGFKPFFFQLDHIFRRRRHFAPDSGHFRPSISRLASAERPTAGLSQAESFARPRSVKMVVCARERSATSVDATCPLSSRVNEFTFGARPAPRRSAGEASCRQQCKGQLQRCRTDRRQRPPVRLCSERRSRLPSPGSRSGGGHIADLVRNCRQWHVIQFLNSVRRASRFRPFRPSWSGSVLRVHPCLHRVRQAPLRRPFLNGRRGSAAARDLQNASFRRRISPNTSESLAPLIPSPDLISAMPARRNGLVASSSDNSDGTVGSPLERASAIRAMRS